MVLGPPRPRARPAEIREREAGDERIAVATSRGNIAWRGQALKTGFVHAARRGKSHDAEAIDPCSSAADILAASA